MTDPTTTQELDTDRARVVAKLADVNDRIATLNAEAEALKAELRNLVPGDYLIDGRPVLRIVPTRRFDADKALELVPEPLRPNCYSTVVDPKKVREYLAPAVADLCMVESGKPRVSVL